MLLINKFVCNYKTLKVEFFQNIYVKNLYFRVERTFISGCFRLGV